jgi:malate dehydrogenase (oxaloacetate-decarboxylating)(NADP+)
VTGGKLADQTLLFQGAGEAAVGIADLVVAAMSSDGLDPLMARQRCWLLDSKGLVVRERTDLTSQKRPYAHEHAPVATLLDAVRTLRPTAIIGVAGVGRAFSEEVVKAMAEQSERPVIFALSNPTSKAECTAEEAYRWSSGRALFACGSPFDPVTLGGRTFVPRQGNNSYIFPGVGLGAIVSRTTRITDDMFMAAAHALAELVTKQDLDQGSLYPPLRDIRRVSAHIAAAVASIAYRDGLARAPKPNDMIAAMKSHMYNPEYAAYVAG